MLLTGNVSIFLAEGLLKTYFTEKSYCCGVHSIIVNVWTCLQKGKIVLLQKNNKFLFMVAWTCPYLPWMLFVALYPAKFLYKTNYSLLHDIHYSLGRVSLHDLHIFQCRIMKYIIPNSCISTVLEAIKISKMVTKLSSSCFFFFIFPS